MAIWVIPASARSAASPDLPVAQVGEVGRQRLGQQDDIAVGEELLAGKHPGHVGRQLLGGDAEALAVATLEIYAPRTPGSMRSTCSGWIGAAWENDAGSGGSPGRAGTRHAPARRPSRPRRRARGRARRRHLADRGRPPRAGGPATPARRRTARATRRSGRRARPRCGGRQVRAPGVRRVGVHRPEVEERDRRRPRARTCGSGWSSMRAWIGPANTPTSRARRARAASSASSQPGRTSTSSSTKATSSAVVARSPCCARR